jgi:hypothetical protein
MRSRLAIICRRIWSHRPVITTHGRYQLAIDSAYTDGALWGLRNPLTTSEPTKPAGPPQHKARRAAERTTATGVPLVAVS